LTGHCAGGTGVEHQRGGVVVDGKPRSPTTSCRASLTWTTNGGYRRRARRRERRRARGERTGIDADCTEVGEPAVVNVKDGSRHSSGRRAPVIITVARRYRRPTSRSRADVAGVSVA